MVRYDDDDDDDDNARQAKVNVQCRCFIAIEFSCWTPHIKILFQVLKLSCRENIQCVVGKDALNYLSMVADCL